MVELKDRTEPGETLPGRRLVCRVLEVRGRCGPGACSYGHLPGAVWEIGETCPAGLCAWAFNALYPFATVLRLGGSLPWEPKPGRARVSCPDPDNTVIFELALED
ncbi:MAG: TIGR04076 family protein [bacterium]